MPETNEKRETLPDDEWTWARISTPDELAKLRVESVLQMEQTCENGEYLDRMRSVGFTCDHCSHAPKCVLAFDNYNIDGDCLLEK